jgi:hypothetical protein
MVRPVRDSAGEAGGVQALGHIAHLLEEPHRDTVVGEVAYLAD